MWVWPALVVQPSPARTMPINSCGVTLLGRIRDSGVGPRSFILGTLGWGAGGVVGWVLRLGSVDSVGVASTDNADKFLRFLPCWGGFATLGSGPGVLFLGPWAGAERSDNLEIERNP